MVGFSNAQQYLVVVGTVAYIRDRLATTFGSTGSYVNLTGNSLTLSPVLFYINVRATMFLCTIAP